MELCRVRPCMCAGIAITSVMKDYRSLFLSGGMALAIALSGYGQNRNLPVVKILGETYYYYEVGKDESVYAIAKAHGWDPAVLARMNPNISSPLEKGTVIYYPVAVSEETTTVDPAEEAVSNRLSHVVEKGETVYSIARRYGVTVDGIYATNPSAQYGVRAGETLLIDTGNSISHNEGGYIYHTVAEGETLYSLSQRYNTSVADILRYNPGVSESNLQAGRTVRLVPDRKRNNVESRQVEQDRVVSVTNYRVKRKDTWMSISRATGVSPELLKAANPEVGVLERGMVLAVPHTESVVVEEIVPVEDPRESTPEGRHEVYNEVNGLSNDRQIENVRVAILLEDITSNKDKEFARGFLVALDRLKDAPYRTSVSIMDAAVATDSLISGLDAFSPSLIVTTHDRNYPQVVSDYARANDIKAVNVFDVRNEGYVSNPDMVQLLTPSEYFNREIADFLARRFDGYTLVVAGENDEEDAMLKALGEVWQGSRVYVTEVSELENLDIAEGGEYLIYGTPSKRNDIELVIEKVKTLRQKSPMADIAVVGRPNWIAYADALGEKYSEAVVYIPSRFYFDPELSESKRLINDYKEMYGHTPIKSYPVYAVAGYDVATYFIPGYASSGGDFNEEWPESATLQTDFALCRPNSWSGFYNPVVYLVKFNEFGNIDKIKVQ